MQTELRRNLPGSFLAQFAPGHDITESTIPALRHLAFPMQAEVRRAFSDSLRVLWFFLLGCAVVGWLSVFVMRELPLHNRRDDRWVLEERKQQNDQDADVDTKQEVGAEKGADAGATELSESMGARL
jgi:hypothetical protein